MDSLAEIVGTVIAPTGANMTITVTTGTPTTLGASLGTLTINDGNYQSNTLTPAQDVAKNSVMVFEVTGVGSTVVGFNVAIPVAYIEDKRDN